MLWNKSLEEARKTVSNHFQSTGCFRSPEPRDDEDVASWAETMKVVHAALEVLDLLEKFPVLASEKYVASAGLQDGLFYPLAFFVWNDFDIPILARVHALHPQASGQLYPQHWQCSSLLHYIFNHCRVGDDESKGKYTSDVLISFASSVEDTFDTSQSLNAYLGRGKDLWAKRGGCRSLGDEKIIKTIVEVLISKSPRFDIHPPTPSTITAGKSKDGGGLLDFLVLLRCDHELVQKTLHRLPTDYRFLDITNYPCRLSGGADCWDRWDLNIADDIPFLKQTVFPELTELKCELWSLDEPHSGNEQQFYEDFLKVISGCSKMKKLSFRVQTEFVRKDKKILDSILSLIQHMSKKTRILIELCQEFGDLEWWLTGPWCDKENDLYEPNWQELTMEHVNNECIQYLLQGLRKSPKGNTLEQVVLNVDRPYYELVAELCTFSATLTLEDSDLGSTTAFNPRICGVWGKKCTKKSPCCHPYSKPLRTLARICQDKGYEIVRALVQNHSLNGTQLEDVNLNIDDPRHKGDVTQALISLIDIGTIKKLQFSGAGNDSDLDLLKFCEVAKKSTELERLELQSLSYITREGYSVAESLLDMVESSPTKKLSFLCVGNDDSKYFFNDDNHSLLTQWQIEEPAKNYMSSPEAPKIQYLLFLNKFGMANLRDRSASAETMAKHLLEVKAAPLSALLKEVNPVCTSLNEGGTLLFSMLYGLLREAPHLWCSNKCQGLVHPKKGLKRGANDSTSYQSSSRRRIDI